MLPREPDLEHRKVESEHLGQHPMGEARGQRPLVRVFFLCQFLAFVQGDGDPRLRLDEQAVFGEEPGEQHSVPVLVGALLHQAFDRPALAAGAGVERVAELPCVGAQPPAQRPLPLVHVPVGFVLVHGERFQRRAGAGFRHVPGVRDGAFEMSSQIW